MALSLKQLVAVGAAWPAPASGSAPQRVDRFLAQFLVDHPGPEIVTVVGYHSAARQDLNVADLKVVLANAADTERLRDQAKRDLDFTMGRINEVGSLKRRITALRRALRNSVHYDENFALGHLEADDARRRRFEAKQRKVAR